MDEPAPIVLKGPIDVRLRVESESPRPASLSQQAGQIVGVIKDGLLAIAVLIGGAWALLRYDLIESNPAKIRYELDLQKSKAQTQMTVRTERSLAKDGNHFVIYGKFILKNIGSRDIIVHCDQDPPISLFRIDTSQSAPTAIGGSKVEAYFFAEDGNRQDYASIDVGNTLTMPFSVVAPSPGIYLLNVSVPVSKGDLSPQEAAEGDGWTWSDQEIFEVK